MVAPNRSLQEKSNARMIAVQIAYSHHMRNKKPNAQVMLNDVTTLRGASQNDEGLDSLPAALKDKPHRPTLQRLIDGYAEHKEVLSAIAQESLHDDWSPSRVNPLLLLVLEFAILELDHQRELSEAIIVDEYTSIAARLLDASDIDFLHASLKKLANKLRS